MTLVGLFSLAVTLIVLGVLMRKRRSQADEFEL
jgi:hypothetical protein